MHKAKTETVQEGVDPASKAAGSLPQAARVPGVTGARIPAL